MNTPAAFNQGISYVSLFPETEFNNLTEAYSQYGAGAFFVELMKIAESQIKDSPSGLSLIERRPDLFTLPITQENIDQEYTYLEKIVDILEDFLSKGKSTSIWASQTKIGETFVPYNRPLAQIQTCLKAYDTSLAELACYFYLNNDKSSQVNDQTDRNWLLNELMLSSSDRAALATLPSITMTGNTLVEFRKLTHLTEVEVKRLIYQDIKEDNQSLLAKLFINQDQSSAGPIRLVSEGGQFKLENLSQTRLGLIQLFLILSRTTGWDYITLNHILTKPEILNSLLSQKNPNQLIDLKGLVVFSQLVYICRKLKFLPIVGKELLEAVASKLKLSISVLEASLKFFRNQNYQPGNDIDPLFNFLRYDELLKQTEISWTDYLLILNNTQFTSSILNIPDYYDNKYHHQEHWDNWIERVQKKIEETINRYGGEVLIENLPDELQSVIFQEWINELAMYLECNSSSLLYLLSGIAKQKIGNHEVGIKLLNRLLVNNQKRAPKFKILLEGLYPYIKLTDKLRTDQDTSHYIGQYIINLVVPRLSSSFATTEFTIEEFNGNIGKRILMFNHVYQQIKSNEKHRFIGIFANVNSSEMVSISKADLISLSDITNWDKEDLKLIIENFELKDSLSLEEAISVLYQISQSFRYLNTSRLTAKDIYTYLPALTVSECTGIMGKIIEKTNKETESNFKQKYLELWKQQLLLDKTILVPIALEILNSKYEDIKTVHHLSDYFLCNLETKGEKSISPVVEGIHTLQLYLMRCKSGLEKVTSTVNQDHWSWITNFRAWKSQKMRSIYPENYLNPTIRSTATELFTRFINNLQQNEVTDKQVEKALMTYLDEWVDLANVRIEDICASKTYSDLFKRPVETLFIVAKSTVKENTFHICSKDMVWYQNTNFPSVKERWQEWKEIPAKINADHVSTIYAFNRIHIFWTEKTIVTGTDPTVEKGKYTISNLTIKYIYQNIDGTWINPQTLTTFPFHITLSSPQSKLLEWGITTVGQPLINQEISAKFHPDNLYWKKIGVVLTKHLPTKADYLQIFFGPIAPLRAFSVELDRTKTNDTSLIDFVNFINKNYEGRPAFTESFTRTTVTTWINPILLDRSLKQTFISQDTERYLFDDEPALVTNTPVLANDPNYRTSLSNPQMVLKPVNKRPFKFNVAIDNKKLNNDCPSILKNYLGTIGDYDSEFNRSTSSLIFKSSLKQPVAHFFTIRNRFLSFYIEVEGTGYLFIGYPCNSDKPFHLNPNWTITAQSESLIRSTCENNFKEVYDFTQYTFKIERIVSIKYNYLRSQAHKQGLDFIDTLLQFKGLPLPTTHFSRLIKLDGEVVSKGPYIAEDSENKIDFSDCFGIYSREFFFHAPLAAAYLLAQNLQYQDAKKYYRRVFYPSEESTRLRELEQDIEKSTRLKSWKDMAQKLLLPKLEVIVLSDYARTISGLNNNRSNPTAAYTSHIQKLRSQIADLKNSNSADGRAYITEGDTQRMLVAIEDKLRSLDPLVRQQDWRAVAEQLNVSLQAVKEDYQNYLNYVNAFKISRTASSVPKDDITKTMEDDVTRIMEADADGLRVIFDDLRLASSDMASYIRLLRRSNFNNKWVWRYLPFIKSEDNISYKNKPVIDLDILAEENLGIYMRWTAQQYIEVLLNHADNEFRKNTWESLSTALPLYCEVEDLLGQIPTIKYQLIIYNSQSNRTYPNLKNKSSAFGLPTNKRVQNFWEKVEDRLYKINNGLDINGDKQSPTIYREERGSARLGLSSFSQNTEFNYASSFRANLPHYRFRELLPHTENVINTVISFGNQLYNILVQKDAEQLLVLQTTHQANMFNFLKQMYQYQVDEANTELEGLNLSLSSATHQMNYYASLIKIGLLPLEHDLLNTQVSAAALQSASAAVRAGAVAAHLLPNIFGFSNGGMHFGHAVEASAAIFTDTSQAMQIISNTLAIKAEYKRRGEEWLFQKEEADINIKYLQQNIQAAKIRLQIAQENQKQNDYSINQSQEIYQYLNTKFSNSELYGWLVSQLSSLYFTTYQLALGSLHNLQSAYIYELDEEAANYIPVSSWNNLRKGLLGGETLKLALLRMQDAYMQKNKRRNELEKIISLKEKNNPSSWESLSFTLSKTDLTRKNYAIIKIKSISVSIPAVIGPYQTFDATLRHSSGQEIIISKGIDDPGVFIEDAGDGRYLPFEGLPIGDDERTTWTFNGGLLANRISDVILTIRFTAK